MITERLNYIVFLTLIILISCQDKNPKKNYNLEVNAINFPDGCKAFLYNRDTDKILDSTIVISERFAFNGNIKIPSLCYLNFEDKAGKYIEPYTFFYLENKHITIKGDYNNFLDAEILGSSQTDLQKNTIKPLKHLLLKRDKH